MKNIEEINKSIVKKILTKKKEMGWEGCLSVPGLRGIVSRFYSVRYSGYTTDGKKIIREAKGFHARVVQHECDHLDGVLYPMRMKDMSSLSFTDQLDPDGSLRDIGANIFNASLISPLKTKSIKSNI